MDRQFAIGKEFFSLPTEEKVKYKADLEHGNYNGYRPKGSGEILPGKRDNVEMYNVFKFSTSIITGGAETVEQGTDHSIQSHS